jgi:hypothetical protein
MKYTVVVLHRKALAHYTVTVGDNGWYEGHLLKYGGSSHDLPPPKLRFTCEGRHCSGNTDEQDLLDDLYHAIQIERKKTGSSTDLVYNPRAPYVSI